LSQRTKIISGYTFTIVLALLVGLWAIANLYRLVRINDAVLEKNNDLMATVRISGILWLGAALVGLLFGLTMHLYQQRNVDRVVAEKQRSEAVIRSISDGIVLVDASCYILTLNPEAAAIFATSPAAAQGKHLFDVVQNEIIFDHVRQAIAEDSALALPDEEATLSIQRDGETYYHRHSVSPVRTADKKTIGVVLMLQDVTHLKELDQLKSEVVMTVSHELRTPLTGIGMSIDLLQEDLADSLSPRQLELFQVAHDDVERLKALVNDLLDLAKLEAGQIQMAFEAIDVALLVEKAMTPFTIQAAEQGVELINQTFDCAAIVWADADKITWLMTNLIANALHYTDAGGHVTLSATTQNRWAFLSVADDGVGIPKSYQSRIFDKFVQVKEVRAAGGTGLGLAISKEIVKAHGGVIWVDSTPGQGSTFTFTLPLAQNQLSNKEAASHDRS
jgi:NtrC-family two-component system sensor histidine kinase KinB